MCVYLHTKFQVSSIILTSYPPSTVKQTPKNPTLIRLTRFVIEKTVAASANLNQLRVKARILHSL